MAKKRTTAEEAAQKIVDAIKSHPETLRTIKDAIEDVKEEAKENAKEVEETLSYFGSSMEELKGLTLHLEKDEYRRLEFMQEVYLALKHYKDGKDEIKLDTIAEMLEHFRFKVSKFGWFPLYKENRSLVPVVAAYGTARDKAALIINAYFGHAVAFPDEERILTEKQAKEIRKGIAQSGTDKEKADFTECFVFYDTFNRAAPLYYKAKYKFFSCALTSVAYFQTYEWLSKAEELFNSFATLVDPTKKEEFAKLTEKYNDYLQNYQKFGELKADSGKGWVDRQRKSCLEWAITATETLVTPSLSEYKGAVVAFNKWVKDKDAELFLPDNLRKELLFAESCSYLGELQSKYYSSNIKRREASGEKPKEEEKKIAVFPEWKDVEPDQKAQDYITTYLDGIRKQIK